VVIFVYLIYFIYKYLCYCTLTLTVELNILIQVKMIFPTLSITGYMVPAQVREGGEGKG
jgi:hypothetical protein